MNLHCIRKTKVKPPFPLANNFINLKHANNVCLHILQKSALNKGTHTETIPG